MSSIFFYIKRPPTIEAFQVDQYKYPFFIKELAEYKNNLLSFEAFYKKLNTYSPNFLKEAMRNRTLFSDGKKLMLKTLTGDYEVKMDDYIVCSPENNPYDLTIWKPDIFKKTYRKPYDPY